MPASFVRQVKVRGVEGRRGGRAGWEGGRVGRKEGGREGGGAYTLILV